MTSPYFTSLKQSRELLNLGLPWSSADCYFDRDGNIHVYNNEDQRNMLPPCWSTGRLIYLYLKSVTSPQLYEHGYMHFYKNVPPIDYVTELIEVAVGLHELDFSLIEEDTI